MSLHWRSAIFQNELNISQGMRVGWELHCSECMTIWAAWMFGWSSWNVWINALQRAWWIEMCVLHMIQMELFIENLRELCRIVPWSSRWGPQDHLNSCKLWASRARKPFPITVYRVVRTSMNWTPWAHDSRGIDILRDSLRELDRVGC